jgi:hypothetical protein
MISESAQPIYIYPDQLISETWHEWVETIFSERPASEHRNSRGFQQLVGIENSNARTRASEAYRIGLLLHRVISERTGTSGAMPKGWEYVCEDKSVLSRLGYLAYIIGKALSKEPNNATFKSALCVLYLIFALSIGTEESGITVSTILVYRRVVRCFRTEIGEAEFDLHKEEYGRWLAGAVFNTLDNSVARPKLINEYINSDVITTLILEKQSDKSTQQVTAKKLKARLDGKSSSMPELNEITRQKAALFWAAPGRGIFTNASEVGVELIDALIPIDRASMSQESKSVLDSVLVVDGTHEHQLLENLNDLLSTRSETSTIWRILMEKLSKGVYSALSYLDDTGVSSAKPTIFHLHGASDVPPGTQTLEVDIIKEAIPIKPEIGTVVAVQDLQFKITSIEELDKSFSFTLEAISNPI